MRSKLLLIIVSLVVWALPGGGTALAYHNVQCDASSFQSNLSLMPNSGPAGTTASIVGDIQIEEFGDDFYNPRALWFETADGDSQFMADLDQASEHVSGQIIIPPASATGPHNVMVYFVSFHDPSNYGYKCVTFNVTDAATEKLSVQQNSYIADLPANLPDTGIALVLPAIVAAASAGGLILMRRRLS